MDEDNNIRALDKLLAMLKSAGWECIADEADSYLVVIDANGDPHECWDGGIPNDVNVCIPLSVENAVDYFADPNQIYLKDENAKLRELIDLKETCWKYVGWCDECPYNGVDDEHDNCICTVQEKIDSLARELGIEVTA